MTVLRKLFTGKTLIILSSVSLVAVLTIAGSQPAQGNVWINDSNIYIGNKGHKLLGTNNKNFRVCNYGATSSHRYESSRWPSWSPTYPVSQRYRSTVSSWLSPKDFPTAPPHERIGEGQNTVDLRMNFIGHYCTANMFDGSGHDPENYQDNYNWSGVNLDRQMVKETRLNTTDNVVANRHPSAPASCNDNPGGLTVSSSIKNQPMSLDWNPAWGNSPGNRPFYVKPGGGDGQPLYKNFSVSGFSDLSPGCYTIRVSVETKSTTRRASDNQWICSKNGAPTNASGTLGSGCPSLTYAFGLIVEIPESQQNIRGYKVAEEGANQNDIKNNLVKMDGGNKSTTSNPFHFESSPGNHSVSVNTGGHNVRYKYCRNQNVPDCDPGSLRTGNGNSFTANVPEGGFVDVRFYFAPIPSSQLVTNTAPPRSQTVNPGDTFSINGYVKNVGDGTSGQTRLQMRAYTGSGHLSSLSVKTKNVGTLTPGERENRSFSFTIKNSASHGDRVCFKSRAKESGKPWVFGSTPSCVNVRRRFRISTNLTGGNNYVRPGRTYSAQARARNRGPDRSPPVRMQAKVGRGYSELSGWNNRSWNLGGINPGQTKSRNFSFRIAKDAREGRKICFGSRARPRSHNNSWWTYSPRAYRTYCVEVVRRFDMRVDMRRPPHNKNYDYLSGHFDVVARLRNMYGPDVDGKRTDERLTASIRVVQGGQYIEPLRGRRTPKKYRPPNNVHSNLVRWSYSGSGSRYQHFRLWRWRSGTPARHTAYPRDYDLIEARTRVKKNFNGRKRVCFRARVSPRTSGGNNWHQTPRRCIWAYPTDAPYMTTEDGDVHSGSVMVDSETARESDCRLNNGERPRSDIIGRVGQGRGSKSTYAVSATGQISSFGSRNSVSGNVLTFGNNPNGYYRSICRPDLTDDKHYERLGYEVLSSSRSNIKSIINRINNEAGQYSNGDEFVVRLTHSSPRFAGSGGELKRGKRVTFITDNNFKINHDIKMESGQRNSRDHIPTMAIISAGDIDIHSRVENINAYLGSNGTIDTCGNVGNITNNVGRCDNNRLNVRGAMVANKILFRRTKGDVNDGDDASEKITFAPEMYLAPSPGLHGITNNIFLQTFARERPPLF